MRLMYLINKYTGILGKTSGCSYQELNLKKKKIVARRRVLRRRSQTPFIYNNEIHLLLFLFYQILYSARSTYDVLCTAHQ